MGCVVNNARITVVITPLKPNKHTLSPSFKVPSTNITSIVVPKPSIFFTSKTVQANYYFNVIFSFKNYIEYFSITPNKSGIPSPVIPDVGTIETYYLIFSFFQYNVVLNPFSVKATIISSYLFSNSCF
jgi:hypothetical protein